MLRHKWFKILVALQILNFAAMALLEQQRRTIWDKEATNAQKILDTKYFTEKTEGDFRYLARLVEGMQARITEVQAAAARDAGNAALLGDIQARVNVLQSQAEKNADTAALIKDIRERVMNLESGLQKLASDK